MTSIVKGDVFSAATPQGVEYLWVVTNTPAEMLAFAPEYAGFTPVGVHSLRLRRDGGYAYADWGTGPQYATDTTREGFNPVVTGYGSDFIRYEGHISEMPTVQDMFYWM